MHLKKFDFSLSFGTRYLIESLKAEIRECLHVNWHDACTPVINIFIPFDNGWRAINQLTYCNHTIDVRYISIAHEIAVKNRFTACSRGIINRITSIESSSLVQIVDTVNHVPSACSSHLITAVTITSSRYDSILTAHKRQFCVDSRARNCGSCTTQTNVYNSFLLIFATIN